MMWLLLTSLAWGDAVCNDGSYSYSSGSGTCSWHGGVAYWVQPPPPPPTAEELMLAQLYESLLTVQDLYPETLNETEYRQRTYDLNIQRCAIEQKLWTWPGGHTVSSILQELAKTKSSTRILHSVTTGNMIRGSVNSHINPHWSLEDERAYRKAEYSPDEIIDWEGIHVGDGVVIESTDYGLVEVRWAPELGVLLEHNERYVASRH